MFKILTNSVIVWREHPDVGELNGSTVAVVEKHLDHVRLVVVGSLLLQLDGGGEEVVVVGLAPEHADSGARMNLFLALRSDLQDLSKEKKNR